MVKYAESNLCLVQGLLKSNRRTDARQKLELRPIKIVFFENYGALDFSLGNTRVIVHTTAEPMEPPKDRSSEGSINFFADFRSAMTADDAVLTKERLLTRTLEKVFKSSKAVDTEGLCIVAGKLVWKIRVDVRLVSFDGNLVDCACLAALASLIHFRRPDVTVIGDEDVTIHDIGTRNPVPLCIHHTPITSTFSLFLRDGPVFCIDPTALEEEISMGSVTIAANPQRELCLFQKPGGLPCSMELINELSSIAISQSVKLLEHINALCKDDLDKRSIKEMR